MHDAVLESIVYDWPNNEVTLIDLLCSTMPSRFTIIFEGVLHLNVPNKSEWGPSNSINEVFDKHEGVYSVQMQSGDVLSISASTFRFLLNDT